MSDELAKIDHSTYQTAIKIERAFLDLEGVGARLTVNDRASCVRSGLLVSRASSPHGAVSVDNYVRRFQWDMAKFPHRRPLPELAGLLFAVRACAGVRGHSPTRFTPRPVSTSPNWTRSCAASSRPTRKPSSY